MSRLCLRCNGRGCVTVDCRGCNGSGNYLDIPLDDKLTLSPENTLANARAHIQQRLREIDLCIKKYSGGSCCSDAVTVELIEILAMIDREQGER